MLSLVFAVGLRLDVVRTPFGSFGVWRNRAGLALAIVEAAAA